MSFLIAPSILSADFSKLGEEIHMLNRSDADWIHVDVMDGVFVPNISLGIPIIEAIHRQAQKPLDVHLMIVNPEKYIETFKNAGADILTVHWEACPHLHRVLQEIRKYGMQSGIALNPHTPIESLIDVLDLLDVVCLMSVNPGFGGQKFIPHTFQKLNRLHQLRAQTGATFLIEIDGGVSRQNAADLVKNGANVLVAGNAVFSTESPELEISEMKKEIQLIQTLTKSI